MKRRPSKGVRYCGSNSGKTTSSSSVPVGDSLVAELGSTLESVDVGSTTAGGTNTSSSGTAVSSGIMSSLDRLGYWIESGSDEWGLSRVKKVDLSSDG